MKLINGRGFSNVQIEDIIDAAHVALGSFYTYFESKEAVVRYIEESDDIYTSAYADVKDMPFVLSGRIATKQYVLYLLETMVGVEVMWCFDETGKSLSAMMEKAIHMMAVGMKHIDSEPMHKMKQ